MKKKIIYSFILLSFLIGLSSCEDDTTAGKTRITYYPDITMSGDPVIHIASGTDYVDAGASATENGIEIEVETSSNLDATTPGSYAISYKATNADGFSKTVKRSIIVYDAAINDVDLAGTYTGHVIRNNDPDKEFSGYEITLTKSDIAPGIFEINCWIARFYDLGYEYGENYQFPGLIQINAANEVVELSMDNAWGDPFDSVTGTYDPNTGVIAYTANWLGKYAYVVDLTKN